MISEELNSRFGRDPVILTAVSELASVGYVTHPDADTIELTPRGLDAACQAAEDHDGAG